MKDNVFMYLVIAELIILAIIVGIRLLFNYLEKKKIQSVLSFIEKRARDKHYDVDKLNECIDIIKANKTQ